VCNFNELYTDLVKLYQTNEDKFHEKRIEILEQQIQDMCVTECGAERCRKAVWRMDRELQKYKDPIVRFNALVEMFYSELDRFNELDTTQEATVIPFEPNK